MNILLTSFLHLGSDNKNKYLAKYGDRNVRIYSSEHFAYWRSDGKGYAREVEGAGVYTLSDAIDRTQHCGPEKKIQFEFIRTYVNGEPPSVKDYQEESIFDCPNLIFDKYKGIARSDGARHG